MRSPTRPDGAERFRTMMRSAGLSYEESADACCVSLHTVKSWMKPTLASSHNRCPEWAVELLRLKLQMAGAIEAQPALNEWVASPVMSPAQCRMARAGLKMGIVELATASGVATGTISRFETNFGENGPQTIMDIHRALQASGVAFIAEDENGGEGVRLAKP